MTDTSIHSVRFRLKSWITVFAVFTVGLLLLVVSQSVQADPTTHAYPFHKVFMEHLATALLAGACISGLYEYFLRKEFLDTTTGQTEVLNKALEEVSRDLCKRTDDNLKTVSEGLVRLGHEAKQRADKMRDFFSANKEQQELGISHCFLEVDRYDFSDTFEDSKKLTIVLNDGRGLISNYYQRFANRFQKDDLETTVILMHPNSPAVDLHAAKVGVTPEAIRMKIAETIGLLRRANEQNRNLNILGHHFFNTMSVFITEQETIVTPYFLSRVRRTPPLFTFADNGRESFYHKIKEDVAALALDCSDISTYTALDGRRLT